MATCSLGSPTRACCPYCLECPISKSRPSLRPPIRCQRPSTSTAATSRLHTAHPIARFTSILAIRAAARAASSLPGTSSPPPKYISSGVSPRAASARATRTDHRLEAMHRFSSLVGWREVAQDGARSPSSLPCPSHAVLTCPEAISTGGSPRERRPPAISAGNRGVSPGWRELATFSPGCRER